LTTYNSDKKEKGEFCKECQEMANDKIKLVAKQKQKVKPKPTSSTSTTPPSPVAKSETSCDSCCDNKVKVIFKNLYVGRNNKSIGINIPDHEEHGSMSWTACDNN
jgi:hypothetical protein